MPSEFRRGTIRIASNYARLFATFILGLIYVPVFINTLGNEAFGLIGLVGSSIGLAAMFSAIALTALNRELTKSYHSSDRRDFLRTYNSAWAVSIGMGIVAACSFGVLYLCLPLLEISNEMMTAAKWVVIAKGSNSVITVVIAPAYLMWKISERMVIHNLLHTAERACELLSILVLIYFVGVSDPSTGLIAYAGIYFVLSTAVQATGAFGFMMIESGLVPNPAHFSWSDVRQVLKTGGWNSIVVTAINLHIRLDQIIMNIFFGLIMGNAIFSIAVRLTSYVRMLANGVTWGLDIVSARLSTTENEPESKSRRRSMSLGELVQHSTLLHAMVTFPAGLMMILYAEPIIRLWVSREIADPEVFAKSVVLTRILAIGMIGRSIANGWERVLYGAGHIRRYAPMILLGGLTNPVIAIVLIAYLPLSIAYAGPSIAYAVVFLTVHFIGMPIVASRVLAISTGEVLAPLLRPACAAVAAGTVLLIPLVCGWTIGLPTFIGVTATYGVAYAALTWQFTLSDEQRKRLKRPVFKRLGLTVRM
jgi:O-antigen/teichoic acid export membrane protein